MALWVSGSKYYYSLENDCRKQNLEKIKAVGDIESHILKNDELSSNFETFQSIGCTNIVNCLLFALSPLTKEKLKNHKFYAGGTSLENTLLLISYDVMCYADVRLCANALNMSLNIVTK